jgi:hypothetical protein
VKPLTRLRNRSACGIVIFDDSSAGTTLSPSRDQQLTPLGESVLVGCRSDALSTSASPGTRGFVTTPLLYAMTRGPDARMVARRPCFRGPLTPRSLAAAAGGANVWQTRAAPTAMTASVGPGDVGPWCRGLGSVPTESVQTTSLRAWLTSSVPDNRISPVRPWKVPSLADMIASRAGLGRVSGGPR